MPILSLLERRGLPKLVVHLNNTQNNKRKINLETTSSSQRNKIKKLS
tara:strand:+ start:272 stop:412 length:141 start_codon:yes stop_codon:yes gene_type:complete